MSPTNELEYLKFAVFKTPNCVWDRDVTNRNIECIDGIKADYFEYLASAHEKELDGPNKQLAAQALRAGYSQALEAFLALLFAAAQAPFCIFAWLPRYRQEDLIGLARAVCEGQPIYTVLKLSVQSWLGIAEAIHKPFKLPDKDLERQLTERVARMWHRFAGDFLNELFSIEYNTIKHGIRGKPGGFRLAVGETPDKMMELGGSDFGSSFFVPNSLKSAAQKGKMHFFVKRHLTNWHPGNYIAALHLIARSLKNIQAFLRYINGVEPGNFNWPAQEGFETSPWQNHVSVLNMSVDTTVEVAEIEPFTEDEILSIYRQHPKHGRRRPNRGYLIVIPKGLHSLAQGRRFGAPWVTERAELLRQRRCTTQHLVQRLRRRNRGICPVPGCAAAATLG